MAASAREVQLRPTKGTALPHRRRTTTSTSRPAAALAADRAGDSAPRHTTVPGWVHRDVGWGDESHWPQPATGGSSAATAATTRGCTRFRSAWTEADGDAGPARPWKRRGCVDGLSSVAAGVLRRRRRRRRESEEAPPARRCQRRWSADGPRLPCSPPRPFQ